MSGRFVLDTNIVIALFAGESTVQSHLKTAKEIFLPCIVLGEIYFGAYKSGGTRKNIEKIEKFACANFILACDGETAKEYGIIKSALSARGRPIPENDIWIAAIAKQHKLILVTRDAHFSNVDNLTVETW
ncbi:MAG: VapC toxin family PIN domain ribonuclease [Candidatus Altiarchaeales archaeon HGW-Altiarchaeales-1]|nr:MAG: VapC toxin family PIN domain ribonuclease [Candidatus Altiarchaeales archaeon HGW-Altiarchaeales-1]